MWKHWVMVVTTLAFAGCSTLHTLADRDFVEQAGHALAAPALLDEIDRPDDERDTQLASGGAHLALAADADDGEQREGNDRSTLWVALGVAAAVVLAVALAGGGGGY